MQHAERVTAVIECDGDGDGALGPGLDVAGQGNTIEEARANLEEALGLFFEAAVPPRSPTASTGRSTSPTSTSTFGRLR